MKIALALADFIPIILFAASCVVLQHGLYNKMSKGAFALLAGGGTMVVSAGLCKAIWKFLYYSEICDFERLNQTMFPMQSLGFLLMGISLLAMLHFPQTKAATLSAVAAPAVFSGTMIFVAFDVFGVFAICITLSILAVKLKKAWTIILFSLAFICLLGMGYLATKDFSQLSMNLIAELTNIVGESALFAGSYYLYKNGMETMLLKTSDHYLE